MNPTELKEHRLVERRADFMRARIKQLLPKVATMVDPKAPEANRIADLKAQLETPIPQPGDDEALDELFSLLEEMDEKFNAADRELAETLAFQGLDDFLAGKTPEYGGDYRVSYGVRDRKYVRVVEIPTFAPRTQTILEEDEVERLHELQEAVRNAKGTRLDSSVLISLLDPQARARLKESAAAGDARVQAAKEELAKFYESHAILPPDTPPRLTPAQQEAKDIEAGEVRQTLGDRAFYVHPDVMTMDERDKELNEWKARQANADPSRPTLLKRNDT